MIATLKFSTITQRYKQLLRRRFKYVDAVQDLVTNFLGEVVAILKVEAQQPDALDTKEAVERLEDFAKSNYHAAVAMDEDIGVVA